MKNPARSFKDLIVWQKAHQFVLEIYRFTRNFPADERFGLTSQIRRAAVSVPANIAEGFPKRGPNDKTRFFNIAQGSLEEVHYYLILAKDLGYGDSVKLLALCDEVGRLLNGYASAILTSNSKLLCS
jgi:four helix bundle protein